MLSFPQNLGTPYTANANGWVGVLTIPAGTPATYLIARNTGTNDAVLSWDQNNQVDLPAGGSISVPISINSKGAGAAPTVIYIANLTNGSNVTGIKITVFP
jgi:hypothetical protein